MTDRNSPNLASIHSGDAFQALQRTCSWVAWSYVQRGDHMTKPPIDPKTGKFASVADASTWGTYEQAAKYAQANGCDGVGVVLTGAEGTFAIDLDNCLGEDGKPNPLAQEVLNYRETYAERSPSGRGVRMFAQGTLDKPIVSASVGVEVYSKGRFVTVTGNAIPGAPDAIREAPQTLKALQRRVEARRAEQQELAKAAVRTPVAVSSSGESFFAKVNKLSLNHLPVWVPWLLPFAKASGDGYRVSSYDLGRDLEEDLSITPAGIKDFGVADMGDERGGCRTAIDLVIEHGEDAGLLRVLCQ